MSSDSVLIKEAKITSASIKTDAFDPHSVTADKNMAMINRARRLVVDYFNERCDKTENFCIPIEKVYVVWFCKTLQNWKALLSTDVPDGMYYELTYNGDRHETYIDAYKKFENVTIPD